MVQKFDFSIDWLEFTYRGPLDKNGFLTLNGKDLWENFKDTFPEIMKDWEYNADQVILTGKSRNFYNMVYAFSDDYSVCYHSEKRQMGVHVTFPGSGIWKISEIFGFGELNEHEAARKLFKILDNRNCEITRLDLAYDDYTKTFTPGDFERWRVEERLTADARAIGYISSGTGCGDTFYIGKRGVDRMIRIYDKEYESKGKIPAIRYEFELKKDWARVVQNHVMNDKLFCFADLLESMFTIKEDWGFDGDYDYYINAKGQKAKTLFHDDACKKSRAAVDEKWQLFLDTMRQVFAKSMSSVVEVSLSKKREESSYFKTLRWFKNTALPSYFILKSIMGEDKFNEYTAIDIDDLSPAKRSLLKKYIKEYEKGVLGDGTDDQDDTEDLFAGIF